MQDLDSLLSTIPSVLDSILLAESPPVVDTLKSMPISYSIVDNVGVVSVAAVNFVDVLYSSVVLFLSLIIVVSLYPKYKLQIENLYRSSKSEYLLDRYLENRSKATIEYFRRVKCLRIILLSYLLSRLVTIDVHFDYFSNIDLAYYNSIFFLIYVLFIYLIKSIFVLINFYTSRIKDNHFWGKIRKLDLLFNAWVCALLLFLVIIVNIVPESWILLIKYIFYLVYVFLFVISSVAVCKIFYKEKVSYYKLILYFCTVKTVEIGMITYSLWCDFTNFNIYNIGN